MNNGTMIATMVAGLFAAGCNSGSTTASSTTPSGATPEGSPAMMMKSTNGKVRCSGINECRGKSACNTATNGCAGKNECKGKGWIEIDTEQACKDKSGAVLPAG